MYPGIQRNATHSTEMVPDLAKNFLAAWNGSDEGLDLFLSNLVHALAMRNREHAPVRVSAILLALGLSLWTLLSVGSMAHTIEAILPNLR